MITASCSKEKTLFKNDAKANEMPCAILHRMSAEAYENTGDNKKAAIIGRGRQTRQRRKTLANFDVRLPWRWP